MNRQECAGCKSEYTLAKGVDEPKMYVAIIKFIHKEACILGYTDRLSINQFWVSQLRYDMVDRPVTMSQVT
jgi:hypothetical protein